MSYLDASYLRAVSCPVLVPLYKKNLENILAGAKSSPNPHTDAHEHRKFEETRNRTITLAETELKDPLTAIRKRLAVEVEKLFEKKKARTLIFGCMHVPKAANKNFRQTQTLLTDLLPKQMGPHEEHHHTSAVTVDYRFSPDERLEMPIKGDFLMTAAPVRMEEIPQEGPDFARRDCRVISNTEDFLYVKRITKIYAERVPFVEKGPLNEEGNIPFFQTIHKLLGAGGIFAFDFMAHFDMVDSSEKPVKLIPVAVEKKEVTQREIDDFIKNSAFSDYFTRVKQGTQKLPPLTCSAHRVCSAHPCPDIIAGIAKCSIISQFENEQSALVLSKAWEEISQKEKAALSSDELFIRIGKTMHALTAQVLPFEEFDKAVLVMKFLPSRTLDEKRSLYYQTDCYRILSVDPDKLSQIHPKTKEVFDQGLIRLVEKVVFPRLKQLGFEKVAFDPNGQNPENKRPFERVISVKKD